MVNQIVNVFVVKKCANCHSYMGGTRYCTLYCKKVKPRDSGCEKFW